MKPPLALSLITNFHKYITLKMIREVSVGNEPPFINYNGDNKSESILAIKGESLLNATCALAVYCIPD